MAAMIRYQTPPRKDLKETDEARLLRKPVRERVSDGSLSTAMSEMNMAQVQFLSGADGGELLDWVGACRKLLHKVIRSYNETLITLGDKDDPVLGYVLMGHQHRFYGPKRLRYDLLKKLFVICRQRFVEEKDVIDLLVGDQNFIEPCLQEAARDAWVDAQEEVKAMRSYISWEAVMCHAASMPMKKNITVRILKPFLMDAGTS